MIGRDLINFPLFSNSDFSHPTSTHPAPPVPILLKLFLHLLGVHNATLANIETPHGDHGVVRRTEGAGEHVLAERLASKVSLSLVRVPLDLQRERERERERDGRENMTHEWWLCWSSCSLLTEAATFIMSQTAVCCF